MSRLGYVRLEAYGLELVGDARVRTVYRDLHDDGSGALIVGWRADDVTIAQLPVWPSPPVLPAPRVEEDDWDSAVTRARSLIAAQPDFVDESATVLDAPVPRPEVVANVMISAAPRARIPPPPLPARRLAKSSAPPKTS